MNETMQTIMTFINEHTLLLIGICVFLILILIGYLIDNSVKSKKMKNDIANIKDEIIKEAEEKIIKKENASAVNTQQPIIQPEETNTNETSIEPDNNSNQTLEINTNDENSNNAQSTDTQLETTSTNEQNESDELFKNLDLNTSNDVLTIETPTVENVQPEVDPDLNIMNLNSENEYSNDMKLSEILFNAQKENVDEIKDVTNNNIFNNNGNDISINNEVKKDDVQIQSSNSSDELDRIMRKLSAMNNNVEDDNYTNIF